MSESSSGIAMERDWDGSDGPGTGCYNPEIGGGASKAEHGLKRKQTQPTITLDAMFWASSVIVCKDCYTAKVSKFRESEQRAHTGQVKGQNSKTEKKKVGASLKRDRWLPDSPEDRTFYIPNRLGFNKVEVQNWSEKKQRKKESL